jgi:TnpA family transposase
VYGRGESCSADGVRFYVPVNLLAADYSHVLQGRGVTLYAHTAANCLRLHQQPIPCRLREAAFVLDGLMEHDTELDPRTCYTDTHGYTEVVMATAALLGFELAPRIRTSTTRRFTSSTTANITLTWTRSSPVQLKRTG